MSWSSLSRRGHRHLLGRPADRPRAGGRDLPADLEPEHYPDRWLTVKLALTGVAAMAVTEAFSFIQAWWAAPTGKAVGLGGSSSIFSESRFGVSVFPTHGITPLGYAAFGFALGVTAGLLIRRPIPAMAVTLAIFAAQFITPLWIRPQLFPSSHTVATIQATGAKVSRYAGA